MLPAVRKMLLLGVGALAVLVMVGVPGFGQGVVQPAGEITDAECYGHHKEAGFRSMDIFPEVISEAPKGETFPFRMTIRNPWLHELHGVVGYVNITDAPGLSFPGEKEPTIQEPTPGSFEADATQTQSTDVIIPVDANATELFVELVGTPSTLIPIDRLGGLKNDYDLAIISPDGALVFPPADLDPPPNPSDPSSTASQPTTTESVRMGYDNLSTSAAGDWTARVSFRGAEPGTYTLSYAVYYNLSKSTELRVPAAKPNLMPGETTTVEFTINAKDADALQLMRYGGIALAFHDHTDRNTEDEGNYNKWNSFDFVLGTELSVAEIKVEETGIDTLSPVFRRWAEVLGFAGTFLMIPSLVLGGTFGKGSVDLFNNVFRSPRRRVLVHNSTSFWLLGTSLLHMILLLYETNYGWSHGLVWGGLALACMIGLGITGATQRAFVAKWGFTRWRFVHFAMGILVAVFVLVHMVADGTHLAPIREAWFGAGELEP